MSRPNIYQQVTFLYTNDLERSVNFYSEIMGLEMVLDQVYCKIFQVSRGGFLGVCATGQVSEIHDDVIFTFVTDQVDEWHSYLVNRNVQIEKVPNHNKKFNIYQMFLRDPNGYLLEIQEFLSPDWPSIIS